LPAQVTSDGRRVHWQRLGSGYFTPTNWPTSELWRADTRSVLPTAVACSGAPWN